MKYQTVSTVILCSVLTASTTMAECNRGGSTSRSTESIGSQFTQSGLLSPFNSPAARTLSQRTQSQQRAIFAQRQAQQQQMFRQAMAQRQQASQLARRRTRSSDNESLASNSNGSNARQDRLRKKNADKAFALAETAADRGRTAAAEKYYRRAIRIAGSDATLIQRAETAIANLAPNRSRGETDTLLASIESQIGSGS